MKSFQSLWVLTDNNSMDITQIESTPSADTEPALTQQNLQDITAKYDYSNIINLLHYIKLKNHAY